MQTCILPAARQPGLALKFLLSLTLHGALLYWAQQAMPGPAVQAPAVPAPIRVVLIEPSRPLPRTVALARPAVMPMPRISPKPAPVAHPTAAGEATPMASAPTAPTAPAAPAPIAVAAVASVAVAAPPALEPARFDADYLSNPAPAYPPLSRRRGETGKVLLLVQVTAHGAAGQVEVKQSSGFQRLDEAALNAVRQWRFVPARRGDATVAASVVVPITFQLGG